MTKIKYRSGSSSLFFQSLDKEIGQLISGTDILQKANRKLWVKMIFYFLLHISSYLVLFLVDHQRMGELILAYIFVGLSGLLLGFNVSHDALHETFSRNKKVNHWLYHFSFNIQGTNAYLWKIRHRSSHHIFPNVDGCDADIDGALKGIGGCPMANDELVGNMNSELMIDYFEKHGLLQNLDREALEESIRIAAEIFV